MGSSPFGCYGSSHGQLHKVSRQLYHTVHASIYTVCFISDAFDSYSLWKEYHAFNKQLGQTGAGLQYEKMQGGSNLQNLIGEPVVFICCTIIRYCILLCDSENLEAAHAVNLLQQNPAPS